MSCADEVFGKGTVAESGHMPSGALGPPVGAVFRHPHKVSPGLGAGLVVVPPFQVRVTAWGLEARPAADPLEQARDVDMIKRLGFAVAPDKGDGSGG